jgi:alanyl-tRNA synthetase
MGVDSMTKRIFDHDPYQVTFIAEVVKQEQTESGEWRIVLDKTAFYPEGGGQPFDMGTLDGVPVLKVYEENGKIYHYTLEQLRSTRVEGHIDFSRRLDHMQQHTGQHILSAAFKAVSEWETVAFHLGKLESTIDIRTEQVDRSTLNQVERLANQIVMENRHIETRFFTREEVEIHYLKKVPNDQETIRMVHVINFDLSACCGTHPYRTGEVGMIKILHTEKHRGLLRISFVCGFRALEQMSKNYYLFQDMVRKLKTSKELAREKLDLMLAELDETKKISRKYYQAAISYEAKELKPSLIIKGDKEVSLYYLKTDSRPIQELKDLAKTVIEQSDRMTVFISQPTNSSYSQWIISLSDSVPLSAKDMISTLLSEYGGNGGGSRVFGQWSGEFVAGSELEFISSYVSEPFRTM